MSPMVLFVFVVGLAAAAWPAFRVLVRYLNQGCRYRCTCVADSVALGALASIAENAPVRHAEH